MYKKKGGSPPVDYNPYEQVDVVVQTDEQNGSFAVPVDPFIENKNKIIDNFQRENVQLKAQLAQNEVLRAQAEGQRRENDLLQARLQARRAENVYDRAIYDRIYSEMMGYIPIDKRLSASEIIADITRKRLIAGLSESSIVSELRDMISEMIKKKSTKKSSK